MPYIYSLEIITFLYIVDKSRIEMIELGYYYRHKASWCDVCNTYFLITHTWELIANRYINSNIIKIQRWIYVVLSFHPNISSSFVSLKHVWCLLSKNNWYHIIIIYVLPIEYTFTSWKSVCKRERISNWLQLFSEGGFFSFMLVLDWIWSKTTSL